MNLYKSLQNIRNEQVLDGNTVLKITCTDGQIIKGKFDCYTQALDNEPEIAQIDVRDLKSGGLIGILETEIQNITVE